MDDSALFFWLGVGLLAYLTVLAVGLIVALWKWARK